jgi:ribosomal-protein-alanine N-acetyltransferase
MLETERLQFRPFTPDDLPWLIEMRSTEAVNRYLGGAAMQNPDALAKRIQFYIECCDRYGFSSCVMIHKGSGELMGSAGLQPLEDTGEIEVGYNMSEKFWRQGYGYEAAVGWLRYGFEKCGLERIVAVALPANTASWRIMEKCGMKYEKNEQHYGFDCVLYAISREEFSELHRT